MNIRAYTEIYVHRAQKVLGESFDYAINVASMSPDDFIKILVGSHISKDMERGNPKYIVGMSGIELYIELIHDATKKYPEVIVTDRFFRSPQYWIGWAVAYYQWYSDRTYSEIFTALPYNILLSMYPTLHEADITKFCDEYDAAFSRKFKDTNLRRYRNALGLTQAELAERSGVSLRSIQLYEQKVKDINRASVESVYRLSKALHLDIESLLEK